MKCKDIEAEIALITAQRDAFVTKLDALVVQFQNELPSLATPWINREVERRIEDHPDVVEKLGVARLKTLKGKVADLIASLPQVVKKETSDKRTWPHYQAPDTTGYGRNKEEPYFNKSFRTVISQLGAVLDEFGLLSEPKGYVPSWERVGMGMFRYAINPGFECLSTETLNEYSRASKEYRALLDKLAAIQAEHAKTKAKELWDSA